MEITRAFARRFRLLELLRASLGLASAFNLGLAVLLFAAPGVPARWLHLAAPEQPAYPWFLASLLAMLSVLYLLAARDPRRYSGIILVAIGGRALEALVLGAGAASRPELSGLWMLAAVDLAFSASHAATWLPLRV
jgi:hypothetical protein